MKRWPTLAGARRAIAARLPRSRGALIGSIGALGLVLAAGAYVLSLQGAPSALQPPTTATPTAVAEPTAASTPEVAATPGGEIQGVRLSAPDTSPFAALATPAPTPTPGVLRPTKHRIEPGETLISIADRYGLRPETLVWANNIENADLIVAGQELTIPPADGLLYTVQPGERLVDLADEYGIPLSAIITANGLTNPDLVLVGDVVFLPGARPKAPSVVAAPAQPEANVAAAEVAESIPLTPALQAVLDAGWERTSEDTQLFDGAGRDARVLDALPAGARLERIGPLQGRRLPVRDPGDGRTRLAMTGWVDALALEPTSAPSPRELPRSYPDDTRMDIPQVFAPYRSQLDGSPYSLANCGPTTISMALAAFGLSLPPGQLRLEVQNTQHIWGNNVGSLITALARVVRDHGLQTPGLYDDDGSLHRWTLDELRAHLAQKQPIVVQVRYRALPGRERVPYYGDHYILLTGLVDDAFLYNDPVDHDGVGWDRVISGARLDQAMNASDTPYAHTAFAVSQ